MSLLKVDRVSIHFGGLTAVNQVSFEVQEGEILSVIGPNGAGKTTLFNIVSGMYEPSSGDVLLNDKNPELPCTIRTVCGIILTALLSGLILFTAINCISLWNVAIVEHYIYQQPFPWFQALNSLSAFIFSIPLFELCAEFFIGAIVGGAAAVTLWKRGRRTPDVVARFGLSRTFQNIRLFSQMSALENVMIGLHTRLSASLVGDAFTLPSSRREQRSSEKKALHHLKFVGLEHCAQLPASKLPYGHQRRLEIARALASKPRILLLDEPAAGMNPSESADLMELIRKIRESGITVLLIEHHMKVVMGISDRVVVLNHGNKIAEGTPDEVRKNPLVIEAYLGANPHDL